MYGFSVRWPVPSIVLRTLTSIVLRSNPACTKRQSGFTGQRCGGTRAIRVTHPSCSPSAARPGKPDLALNRAFVSPLSLTREERAFYSQISSASVVRKRKLWESAFFAPTRIIVYIILFLAQPQPRYIASARAGRSAQETCCWLRLALPFC